jgi:hypothetical protein
MEEGVGRARERGGGGLGAVAGYSLFGGGCDDRTAGAGTVIGGSGLRHNQTMVEDVPLLGI